MTKYDFKKYYLCVFLIYIFNYSLKNILYLYNIFKTNNFYILLNVDKFI